MVRGRGYTVAVDAGRDLVGMGRYAELLQLVAHRIGQAFGQGRQYARCRIEDSDGDAPVRVEVAEAVVAQPARDMVQLGCQLDPGGAGADDRHVEFARLQLVVVCDRLDKPFHQAFPEGRGLLFAVEKPGAFLDSRDAETMT